MQAPAQGLGQLMQQRQAAPQQPQMPSPQSGGPMAGLGSVEDRVAAYRGNPAPLQQRYAMSQDLLDLLALQKIKSEKENAARQMQMQMAQQQAAQGGEPPTIAQQRENEVRDLTKRELAQQVGGVNNQRFQAQQQGMQKLMQGIARAPGAQAAAQPRMMATGGIVAFAGPEGSYVGEAFRDFLRSMGISNSEYANMDGPQRRALQQRYDRQYQGPNRAPARATPVPETKMPRGEQLGRAAGQRMGQGTSAIRSLFQEGLPRAANKALGVAGLALTPRDIANEDEALAAMRGEAYGGKPYDTGRAQAVLGRFGMPAEMAGAEAPREPYQDEALRRMRAGDVNAPTPPGTGVPPTARTSTPSATPTTPAQAAPGGVGLQSLQLPNAPKPAVPEMSPEYKRLMALGQEYAQAGAPTAAQDAARAEEYRVEGLMGLRPEERATLEKNTAELEAMRMTPEQMRKRGLIDFMTGAGGRRYNVLGGASKYAAGQEQQRVKGQMDLLKDIQASRLKPIDVRRDATKEGITAGRGLGKTLGEQGIAGLRTAGSMAESRQQQQFDASAKQLDAQIRMLQAQIQADATAAAREGTNLERARATYATAVGRRQELERRLQDGFTSQYGMLIAQEQAGNLDEAQKNQLDVARKQLQLQIAKVRQELDPIIQSAKTKLGVSDKIGTSGWKVTELPTQ